MTQNESGDRGPIIFGAVFGIFGLLALGVGLFQDAERLQQPRAVILFAALILIVLGLWMGQAYRLFTPRHEWARRINWHAGGAGVFSLLLGVFVILMSLTLPASEFNAPRWVAVLFGGVFVAAGLLVVKQYIADQGIQNTADIGQSLLVAILFTCFGLGVTWISLGPGERNFTTHIAVPFLTAVVLSFLGDDLIGRLIFFPAAAILDVLAVLSWIKVGQNLLEPWKESDAE